MVTPASDPAGSYPQINVSKLENKSNSHEVWMLLKGLFLHRALGWMSLCVGFFKRCFSIGHSTVALVNVWPIVFQARCFRDSSLQYQS